jgi:hypothetical protein
MGSLEIRVIVSENGSEGGELDGFRYITITIILNILLYSARIAEVRFEG